MKITLNELRKIINESVREAFGKSYLKEDLDDAERKFNDIKRELTDRKIQYKELSGFNCRTMAWPDKCISQILVDGKVVFCLFMDPDISKHYITYGENPHPKRVSPYSSVEELLNKVLDSEEYDFRRRAKCKITSRMDDDGKYTYRFSLPDYQFYAESRDYDDLMEKVLDKLGEIFPDYDGEYWGGEKFFIQLQDAMLDGERFPTVVFDTILAQDGYKR